MGLRILLVDDHEVVRLGVRALIERQPNMEVIGEASTVAEAVTLCIGRIDVKLLFKSLIVKITLSTCVFFF